MGNGPLLEYATLKEYFTKIKQKELFGFIMKIMIY